MTKLSDRMMKALTSPAVLGAAGLLLLAALAAVFGVRAFHDGVLGTLSYLGEASEAFRMGPAAANVAIWAHMAAGGLITIAAPLQLIGQVRRRAPRLHRWSGYALALAALLTAAGGLTFIGAMGTIGGPAMSVAFAIYGLLLALAAVQTVRFARARDFARHRRWALRFFFLAIGSFLYRVHYGLWHLAFEDLWIEPGFTGPFDLVQLYAFYVPYLLALEVLYYFERRAGRYNVPNTQSQNGVVTPKFTVSSR